MSTVDFDTLALPDGGNYPLEYGATYVLTRPKPIKCRLIGTGNIVRYLVGKADSQALQTVRGCDTAGCENVLFELAPGTAAVGGSGGFHGLNLQVQGGGGLFHIKGNSHKNQFLRCIVADTVKDSYIGYAGPDILDANGVYKTEHACAGVELITCEVKKGVTGRFHGFRFHGTEKVIVHGGNYTFAPDPRHYNAAIRVHDCGECEIDGATFTGSGGYTFGPMDGGDGGVNLPAGPKRAYCDAMRLGKLTIRNTTFDGKGYAVFTLLPGILAGTISNVKLLNLYGSRLILNPYPYMTRPACKLALDHLTGTLANAAKPVFFSDDDGAKNLRVTSSTVNGRAYTH